MANRSHSVFRAGFAIFAALAILASGFAPMLAQQATPVVETPTPVTTPEPTTGPESTSPILVGTPSPEIVTGTPASEISNLNANGVGEESPELLEPFAATEGTVIHLQNTIPDLCPDPAYRWVFEMMAPDPSIRHITVQFSNGDTRSYTVPPSGGVAHVIVESHLQYMVVDAWAYSDLPISPVEITLIEGPCNEPVFPDQEYSASFELVVDSFDDDPNAFDDVEWELLDDDQNLLDSGLMSGSTSLNFSALSNGQYDVSFTDSNGVLNDKQHHFTIADQNVSGSITFFPAARQHLVGVYLEEATLDTTATLTLLDGTVVGTLHNVGTNYSDPTMVFPPVPGGTYVIVATSPGYIPAYREIDLQRYSPDDVSPGYYQITMKQQTLRSISGMVADFRTEETIEGATISIESGSQIVPNHSATSDIGGEYFAWVPNFTWNITVSAPGYHSSEILDVSTVDSDQSHTIFLKPIDPIPITLQVDTSDNELPTDVFFEVKQGQDSTIAGTFGDSNRFPIGDFRLGETYTVSLDGSAAGYENAEATFTVTTGQNTWLMPLDVATHQKVTLRVGTSDNGSPELATYVITDKDGEFKSGTLDEFGSVPLGDLPLNETYTVSIDGTDAGYETMERTFTVELGRGIWIMELDPLPTQGMTLQVSTSDGGSPAGFGYILSYNGSSVSSGNIGTTNPVQFDELKVSRTYHLVITDPDNNYAEFIGDFTVVEGETTWSAELQRHQRMEFIFTFATDRSGSMANISVDGIPRGSFEQNVAIDLGYLQIGQRYEIYVFGIYGESTHRTEEFTVVEGETLWRMNLYPNVDVSSGSLQVDTSDNEPPVGVNYAVEFDGNVEYTGVLDGTEPVPLDYLHKGSTYSVTLTDPSGKYITQTTSFTVNETNEWEMTLKQGQSVTLNVGTSDDGPLEDATYVVMHGQVQVASGQVDDSGSVDLGVLLVGEQYQVLINDALSGYLNANESFTVKGGEPTWTVTLQAMPDVTVEVLTDDGGSPVGLPFTYSIDHGPEQEGVLDSSALISIGKLTPGTRVDVKIDADGSVYNSHELIFSVNANQNTWSLTLRNNAPQVSLEVTTSDDRTPEGATYLVMHGEDMLTTGTLDESGLVNLGELPIYETYEVIIDGAQTGYGGTSREFTVYQTTDTWTLILDPLPVETTANVTLNISTNDGESPEGATFTISEAQPQAASTGFIGGSLLQVTTPITGTIPADGTVPVGDLTIGTTYMVSISGEVAGYNDLTTNFTVDAASPNVDITLVALQPVETETPTPSPTATDVPLTETPTATTDPITETPSPTATTVPVTETPSPTATTDPITETATATDVPETPMPSPSATASEAPATALPTTPTGTPDAPGASGESEEAASQPEVSALPSTGAGSDSMAVIVLMATGLILIAIGAGFVIRRGDQR